MLTAEEQRDVFAAALREAEEELRNIDAQLDATKFKHLAPISLRVRRTHLCTAIDGLSGLVKSLATV